MAKQSILETLQANETTPHPHDTMAEAGRKAMLHDMIQLLENETGSRSGERPEDLHQMRVATRRLRSLFKLLDAYYKSKKLKPHVEHVQRLASLLGDVRDMDVMIGALQNDDQADILPIIEKLERERGKARKKLVKFLDASEHKQFVKDFSKFLLKEGKWAKKVNTEASEPYQIRHVLPVIVNERLAAVRAYDTMLTEPDPGLLHKLRIEFKQLRYLIAHFAELLGTGADDFIEELKVIQDYLGGLNDTFNAQVQLTSLREKVDLTSQQLQRLQTYLDQLHETHQSYLDDFGDVWERFNTRTVQQKLSNALLVLR